MSEEDYSQVKAVLDKWLQNQGVTIQGGLVMDSQHWNERSLQPGDVLYRGSDYADALAWALEYIERGYQDHR
jgi:hypothetical protein